MVILKGLGIVMTGDHVGELGLSACLLLDHPLFSLSFLYEAELLETVSFRDREGAYSSILKSFHIPLILDNIKTEQALREYKQPYE